jgi:hypothetical protein
MEGKDGTRAGMRIALVAEKGLGAGRFVEKGEGFDSARQELRQELGRVCAVMAGLVRHGGQHGAGSFRLDDTDRFAIYEQEVVATAGLERDFAKSDPLPNSEV